MFGFKDLNQAEYWFRRAGDMGQRDAYAAAAHLLTERADFSTNEALWQEALDLFDYAASMGSAHGVMNYARFNAHNDANESLRAYELAVRLEPDTTLGMNAAFRLGLHHFLGFVVPENPGAALQLFQSIVSTKSSDNGSMEIHEWAHRMINAISSLDPADSSSE